MKILDELAAQIHPQLEYRAFGDKNPDKSFLVIQQGGHGRGLFSLVSAIICWIDVAQRNKLIPVIDFENYPNEYSEPGRVEGKTNSFEFFFEPVSPYPLVEVYQSKNVYLTDNRYPSGYSYSINTMPHLLRAYNEYVRVRPEILAEVDSLSVNNLVGVHYRGQEMRYAAGHWLPPSKRQMLHAINLIFKSGGHEGVYICTEDQTLLESIIKEYGSAVLYRDHYRTTGENAYRIPYPRTNHKFNLGREILIDTLTLARCRSFVGCTSNVAAMARFLNHGSYFMDVKIDNGPNKWRRPFNYLRWPLAAVMPAALGGLRIDESAIKVTYR